MFLLYDADKDGLRDFIADLDDDNDGVPDTSDDFPFDPTESVDTDGDRIGDSADTDDDNDGVPDGSDPFPLDPGPLADAGPDQSVQEQVVVNLNGSNSTDPGGGIVSYQWSQDSGTAVTITNATASMASFTAPSVDTTATTLVFRLEVTDTVGQTGEDTVTVEVNPNFYNVAGVITAAAGTAVDSDVNDTFANYAANDSIAQAQPITNPVALGGYLNVAGNGANGRSRAAGDESDYFSVNVQAGQQIALVIADSTSADLDLYLYNSAGVQIDASEGVDAVESLTAPSEGAYYVEVYAFSGASNYQLFIGQTQGAALPGGFRLSDDFVPGEMVVRYRDESLAGMSMASARTAAANKGLQIAAGAPGRSMLARIDQARPAAQARAQRQGAVRGVAFADDTQRLKHETLIALKALNRDPSVAYAHPNYIVKATATPNDPYYPLQWHLDQIAAPTAWDITTGDPGVTVAVLDTGVLLNHPDLQGQLVAGYDFISDPARAADGDGIDADPDDPGDSNGVTPSSFHGTHVAGTIAAATSNGVGVAGVAWNIKVMPIRVLGVNGGTTYDIEQAVRYGAGLANDSGTVANPVVDVMNLSLGGFGSCFASTQQAFNDARTAGVIVVVAAGNESSNASLYSPASCNNVITTSALDINSTLASYSNYGAPVDVAAPGGDNTPDVDGDGNPDMVLSTSGDDSSGAIQNVYVYSAGTSMAAPHVAGVVALMRSVNSTITPAQVDQLLAAGELTDDLGNASLFGYGRINAYKSVFAALNAGGAPPPASPTLGATPGSLNFGTLSTLATLTVRNVGSGSLQANAPTDDAAWLTVSASSIGPDNLGTYVVSVDRSGLAEGFYSATITITSDANTVQVPVFMEVRTANISPDAGLVYILLVDPDTYATVAFDADYASAGAYLYQMTGVPDGTYLLFAGSDSDNDFFICDAGEPCGAYPFLDRLQLIDLDGNRSGVNFTIGHDIPLDLLSTEPTLQGGIELRRIVE